MRQFSDNLFVGRKHDGSVRILKWPYPQDNVPDANGTYHDAILDMAFPESYLDSYLDGLDIQSEQIKAHLGIKPKTVEFAKEVVIADVPVSATKAEIHMIEPIEPVVLDTPKLTNIPKPKKPKEPAKETV